MRMKSVKYKIRQNLHQRVRKEMAKEVYEEVSQQVSIEIWSRIGNFMAESGDSFSRQIYNAVGKTGV